MEIPSIEYPSKSTPLRVTEARAFLYSSSSSIARPIADKKPEDLREVEFMGLLR